MPGVSFNNTKLSYKTAADSEFTELEGLQEVPEFGGDAEKIDVTVLSDKAKKYIPGIVDLGDLAFKFRYDNSTEASNYRILKSMEENKTVATYKLEYPDGSSHQFDAYVNVKIDSGGVNSPIAFTASFILQSDISTTNPS